MAEKPPSRNSICPYCDSGRTYAQCCMGKMKQRLVEINKFCKQCGNKVRADFTEHFANKLSGSSDLALKNYCKSNGFYMFGFFTVHDHLELIKKFEKGKLQKEDFYTCYKNFATQEYCKQFFKTYCEGIQEFKERQVLLYDAIETHFSAKFTLSIPAFFILIEGILRNWFGIKDKDDFKPQFRRNIWDARLMFGTGDSVEHLNWYLNMLFEGKAKSNSFNRNPIMHGNNTKYGTEENSLSLMLVLLEIGSLKLQEAQTHPIAERFVCG